jgi:hypothetical protein
MLQAQDLRLRQIGLQTLQLGVRGQPGLSSLGICRHGLDPSGVTPRPPHIERGSDNDTPHPNCRAAVEQLAQGREHPVWVGR